jgi:hypothetical protein
VFGDSDDQLLPDVTRVEIDVRDRVQLAVEETSERSAPTGSTWERR